jgi:small-conductance mechanosensitive channel
VLHLRVSIELIVDGEFPLSLGQSFLLMMKAREWIGVIALLALVVATIVGLVLTSNPSSAPVAGKVLRGAPAQQTAPLVDQKPLQTARALAPLAATPEAQNYAHEALKLADYEVDLAFADALRDAAAHPPQMTPELHDLTARITQAEAAAKASQDRVALLTKQLAAANDRDHDSIQDQLDIAKAQLELDQDELDDAKEDLVRAGGNPSAKIQRLQEEHEAGHTTTPTTGGAPGAELDFQAGSLWPLWKAWVALRSEQQQLVEARNDALLSIQVLGRKHDILAKQIASQSEQKQTAKQKAAGLTSAPSAADVSAKQAAKEAISSLHRFSNDQRVLSDLDKRIQNQQELADVYKNWGTLVYARQLTALHGILQSFLWILLIALLVYLSKLALDGYFADLAPDKKRLVTLRAVLWFAIQALGILLAALVIFGMPSQMPTILGLAGAGLTVALKDFIVGFVGWFALMGRNGIRVGDWVEINGVGGEVVEIGLLRTVLLETGNWNDSGHPTGRKVSFVNSYAIEGHYFNFSTSGQWLWDEITLSLPASQNPYPMMEAVQKLIVEETAKDARTAEEEWQRAAQKYRMHSFSAAPAINLRPTGGGIELHVRYITRAYERQTRRTQLYNAIVELMHHKSETPAANATGAS